MLAAGWAAAQASPTGIPPFASLQNGAGAAVNLADLDVHFSIPLVGRPGRGLSYDVGLSYDNQIWMPVGSKWALSSGVGLGWSTDDILDGNINYLVRRVARCIGDDGLKHTYEILSNFEFTDGSGTVHAAPYLEIDDEPDTCGGSQSSSEAYASDGSGIEIGVAWSGPDWVVYPDGTTVTGLQASSTSVTAVDRNGNEITDSSGVITDTLGTAPVSISSSGSTATYTYTGPNGAENVQVVDETATVQTNFGCAGIAEFPATTEQLLQKIVYPDGTSYSFTYEPTPGYPSSTTGRIASITMPSGATITFAYSGGSNGVNCDDGSAAGVTRTTPDGAWTYAHVTGTTNTSSVTDPLGNVTQIHESGDLVTEAQNYTGAGTLLKTTYICYNGATPTGGCNGAITFPVTTRDVYTVLPPGNVESEAHVALNARNQPTEEDDYDFGAGAPGSEIRRVVTSYVAPGNNLSLPSSVQVYQGATLQAETDYTYDVLGPQSSGATQLQAISGARGNANYVDRWVAGSTKLRTTVEYYDDGMAYRATDPDGGVTTYASYACDDAFPSEIEEPVGTLTRYMGWNCTGGVIASATDENGKATGWSYGAASGAYWRPSSIQDAAGNTVNYTYTDWASTEQAMNFATSSTADVLTSFDSLGRPHIVQRRQGPAPGTTTFDSVETNYDQDGRAYEVSLPYSATAGQGYTGSQFTKSTFDGLGRPLTVTNLAGGTVSYAYNDNDTLMTRSGSPAVNKQLQYNALGSLTSVCEVTTVDPGYGACGQSSAETGYWTVYTRDALGDLTAVAQNDQSGSPQTRTFHFDGLGRLTSAVTPESGTIAYSFGAGADCSGSFPGDLVERKDAMNNVTCYQHDAMHRLTGVTYPSGPYASPVTANKTFVYDASSAGSFTLSNIAGRLAEAYTGTAAAKITDLVFSYDPLGNATTAYEDTPHSGGWYQVNETYAANGAPAGLSMTPGVFPAITFGLDGEGRVGSVTAGSSSLASASYGLFGVTGVTFGSSDSDAYSYDPATGRMTQYALSMNGNADTGALTWNANGTLAQLNITDGIPGTSDPQTCNYTQDDLGRIKSMNCGTASLNESFQFDAFGNALTNGSNNSGLAFSAGYTNNRINGQTYDANGNLEGDPVTPAAGVNAFDAEGKATTLEQVPVIYDALGRAVEAARPDGTMEFVYAPSGARLALMSGQSVVVTKIGLPGGGVAAYDGSGLQAYGHADRLGNIPLFSTPARGLFMDAAYTPYGAEYDQSGGATWRVFTGKDQGIDWRFSGGQYDFPEREYNSIQGRWWTPDPSGLAAVNPNDPQSWNEYSYVGNTPLLATDPLGLNGYEQHCSQAISDSNGQVPNSCAGSVAAKQFTESAECGQEVFDMWGSSVPCSIALSEFSLGSIAACPNNVCSGWGPDPYNHNQAWLTFAADAETSEYLSQSDWSQGVNDWNGSFVSNKTFEADLEAAYAPQIATQCGALKAGLPVGASTKCQVDYIQGGHANFSLSCGGDCAGRYAGGVHIESKLTNGVYQYWGHVDSDSPYIGPRFEWGSLHLWPTIVHLGVDVVFGTAFVNVF